ncbi:4-alpha-glucanotransferase [Rhizobium sp. LEGMi198b]
MTEEDTSLSLMALAATFGIQERYEDLQGVVQKVPFSTRLQMLKALGVPVRLDPSFVEQRPQPRLTVSKGVSCFLPFSLQTERAWGISAQLYELKSARNWGIGDLEDLKHLCTIAAQAGADFVGLNPLHALFLAEPTRCSPYSPSNRLFLNPIYLAVDKIPGFEDDLVAHGKLVEARTRSLVDYKGVAELKIAALKVLWSRWKKAGSGDALLSKRAFEDFKDEGGEHLYAHCLFETLSCEMCAQGYGSGWYTWPDEFRNRRSPAVHAFGDAQGEDVDFHAWLQWLTSVQLNEAKVHARAVGLRIGLYLDFAIGEVPDGSSTWSAPHLVLPQMRIGAPPDAFNAQGQDWGLVPVSPVALQDPAGPDYKELLDRTARFAGAIRLDHALGLWQLFLIPAGETPAAGGYLRYPFTEMTAHLAEVSQKRRTIIIGEDLGNVPAGFRPAMQKAGVLGYKVLYFEDLTAEESPTTAIPHPSLACLSTHDLPPLIGWWRNDDISFAERQNWCDAEAADRSRAERHSWKLTVLQRLVEADLIDAEVAAQSCGPTMPEAVVVALAALLSKSSSVLVALRLADMVGEYRSTNVPGTSSEYPNWRVKLQVHVEQLSDSALFATTAAAQIQQRPKASSLA